MHPDYEYFVNTFKITENGTAMTHRFVNKINRLMYYNFSTALRTVNNKNVLFIYDVQISRSSNFFLPIHSMFICPIVFQILERTNEKIDEIAFEYDYAFTRRGSYFGLIDYFKNELETRTAYKIKYFHEHDHTNPIEVYGVHWFGFEIEEK